MAVLGKECVCIHVWCKCHAYTWNGIATSSVCVRDLFSHNAEIVFFYIMVVVFYQLVHTRNPVQTKQLGPFKFLLHG